MEKICTKNKLKIAEYYQENKLKIAEYSKKYRAMNKDKMDT